MNAARLYDLFGIGLDSTLSAPIGRTTAVCPERSAAAFGEPGRVPVETFGRRRRVALGLEHRGVGKTDAFSAVATDIRVKLDMEAPRP